MALLLREDGSLRARLLAFIARHSRMRAGRDVGIRTTDYLPFSGMPTLSFSDLRTDALIRLAEYEVADYRRWRAVRAADNAEMGAAA